MKEKRNGIYERIKMIKKDEEKETINYNRQNRETENKSQNGA